ELAALLRVAPVRPTVSACFVSSDVEVEYAGGDPQYPIRYDWKGIAIDADLRSSAPVGIERLDEERAFLLVSGLEGSILEDRIFEDDLKVEAISTAKLLQTASAQGVEVLHLGPADVEGVLDGLPFDDAVKEEIRSGAARGLSTHVPVLPITAPGWTWTGVGYVLLDEETGEAAYQL